MYDASRWRAEQLEFERFLAPARAARAPDTVPLPALQRELSIEQAIAAARAVDTAVDIL